MPGDAPKAAEVLAEAPPWVEPGAPAPDSRLFTEAEQAVAGALSTLAPFSDFHPAWALPFAGVVLDALAKWEPTDA